MTTQHNQDQILSWLGGASSLPGQTALQIGQKIESFEVDFSNGYLFGIILTQYGICESLSTFSRQTTKEAKCHNFYQIEDALRNLKVPFDAKLIHNIMSEEPGAALRLLHMLRKTLDKHFTETDLTVTGLQKSYVDQKVKKVADLATKLPAIHKKYGVTGPTFNCKSVIKIEEKLLKYEVRRKQLEEHAEQDELSEKNMLKSIQQLKRQEAMKKLMENRQFMDDWMATGKKNWRKNRERRAAEIQLEEYFVNREIQIYKDMLNRELVFNTTDMVNGVEEFQENLRKLGIEENITIQEAIKRQEEKKGIPPGQIQNFSYAATMNKIKETKNNNEFAGKERERRNRKLQVDQRKIQAELDQQKKDAEEKAAAEKKRKEEEDAATKEREKKERKDQQKQTRVEKAIQLQHENNEKNAEIRAKMKEEADAVQDQRAKEHYEASMTAKQRGREEKQKRRRVNVEIASEIIDLIMDVADEAYDFQEEHKAMDDDQKYMDKQTWRRWMDIFTKGLLVSEQNIVVTKEEVVDKSINDQSAVGQLIGKCTNPIQIMEAIKNEPIFNDFLQYLTMSGPLNLRLAVPEKWAMIKAIAQKEHKDKRIDLGYLDQFYAPLNTDLGSFIETLYEGMGDEGTLISQMNQSHQPLGSAGFTKTFQSSKQIIKGAGDTSKSRIDVVVEEVEQKLAQGIPNYHTLKLAIIGKAYAGKKTHAKKIMEKYAGKLQTFSMDEMIREAVTINMAGSQSVESIDPKKGAAKGKPADTKADAYAGLDTTALKEISANIMKQIKEATGSDAVPGKETDIMSLVADDSLLVKLFIQKLKLTFPNPPPTKEAKLAEMKENLAKAKELQEQLEEALANEQVVDDKAKGKPGKATKSPQEIEADIKALLSVEVNGWILLDFPRTINQAKLLENAMTGYTSPTDCPKGFENSNFEVWSKLTDPPVRHLEQFIRPQNSFFDGVLMLSASNEECKRRATGRKVDPTTQTVYHPQDNAAPEGDAKLLDRLQPFFGVYKDQEELYKHLDNSHFQFADQEILLKKFYSEFGALDQDGAGLSTLSFIEVKDSQSTSDVSNIVKSKVQAIVEFKQISHDREYKRIKETINSDKSKEQLQAEDMENADNKSVAKSHISKELSVNEVAEGPDVAKQTFSKHSIGSSEAAIKNISKQSLGMSNTKTKKVDYTREYKIKIWEQMITAYFRDGMSTLNEIKQQGETVIDCLNLCQSQFIQFLERPSNQEEKIEEFVKSFNQFAQEFPDLRNDDQTKEELLRRVDTLSNQLWMSIEVRKNEGLQEIQKQSEEGWSEKEMKNVCKHMANLIEIEIKKFTVVYQIVKEGEPPVELDAEIFVKKMLERGVRPYDAKTRSSPILHQVVSSLLGKMEELFAETLKNQAFHNDLFTVILEQEKRIFTYRLALINSWGLAILEEISAYSQKVYEYMDEWIVDAVALENFNILSVLTSLKEIVQSSRTKINDFEIQVQQPRLMDKIQQVEFTSGTVPLYLQNVHIPFDELESTRFETVDLDTLYKEMKACTGFKGSSDLIDAQSSLNILSLAFRHGRIPLVWKFMSFEKISQLGLKFAETPLPSISLAVEISPVQYQSQLGKSMSQSLNPQANNEKSRQWVNWKKMLTHFTLLNSPVPSEKQLEDYVKNLMAFGPFVSLEQFQKTRAWFDSVEGQPGAELLEQWAEEQRIKSQDSDFDSEDEENNTRQKLDTIRLGCIKEILFNLHRAKTGEDKLCVADLHACLKEMTAGVSDLTFSQLMFE